MYMFLGAGNEANFGISLLTPRASFMHAITLSLSCCVPTFVLQMMLVSVNSYYIFSCLTYTTMHSLPSLHSE